MSRYYQTSTLRHFARASSVQIVSRQLAQDCLYWSEVVRLKDEIIKSKDALLTCYRLGTVHNADKALTRIELAEKKLAELEAS